MDKNIHFASGFFKRKLKKEKDKAHAKTIKKIPKLQTFFTVSKDSINNLQILNNDCEVVSTSNSRHSSQENLINDTEITANINTSSVPPVNEVDSELELRLESAESERPKKVSDIKENNFEFKIDFTDPALWPDLNPKIVDYIIKHSSTHLLDVSVCDITQLKLCIYSNRIRYANKQMMFTRLQNGELKKLEWLMYLNSTGCFYCISCKLFHAGTNSFKNGFND